jgi:acyl-CoA synthetase (AMP-forming)/AMP-acid ligase II
VWGRLRAAAAGRETAVAVGREGLEWTFGELIQRAEAVAGKLSNSGRPLRVGVALPGGPEFTAMQFGCLRAGALFVPLPELATQNEAQHYLSLAEVDVLVADPSTAFAALGSPGFVDFDSLCADDCEVVAGDCSVDFGADTRLLQFTTGSTGRPSASLVTDSNLVANLQQSARYLPTTSAVFCPLPQFHATGVALTLENLCHGAAVLFANQFDPAQDLQRMETCSRLIASPNFVRMLLRLRVFSAAALPNLTEITLATAPVSKELVAQLRTVFPDVCIRLRYGLSEAVGALTVLTLESGEELRAEGDVGPLVDGVDARIQDGELCVRGGSVAARSVSAAGVHSLVSSEGFLSTGDDVVIVDGHVHLRGRRSTFLKVHGYRIDPIEIEAVLREHEGIAEAVVLGVPDPESGQRVVACVEYNPGVVVSDEALSQLCRDRLSAYKCPVRIVSFDSLLRTPAGKPDRSGIEAQLDP